MQFLIGAVVVIGVWWFWRSRRYDKQTTLDFDVWLAKYERASSPFQRSGMATAFLAQSIHLAWTAGAINSKERDIVTATLKKMHAPTVMTSWLGSAMPAVVRATSQAELFCMPARAAGKLFLLAWMSPDSNPEEAVRRFLFRR
jgi:hypothetical protein